MKLAVKEKIASIALPLMIVFAMVAWGAGRQEFQQPCYFLSDVYLDDDTNVTLKVRIQNVFTNAVGTTNPAGVVSFPETYVLGVGTNGPVLLLSGTSLVGNVALSSADFAWDGSTLTVIGGGSGTGDVSTWSQYAATQTVNGGGFHLTNFGNAFLTGTVWIGAQDITELGVYYLDLMSTEWFAPHPAREITAGLTNQWTSALTNNQTEVTLAGTFAGDGSGLTNITASSTAGVNSVTCDNTYLTNSGTASDPSLDLTPAVQATLSLADSAVQTEADPVAATSVWSQAQIPDYFLNSANQTNQQWVDNIIVQDPTNRAYAYTVPVPWTLVVTQALCIYDGTATGVLDIVTKFLTNLPPNYSVVKQGTTISAQSVYVSPFGPFVVTNGYGVGFAVTNLNGYDWEKTIEVILWGVKQ